MAACTVVFDIATLTMKTKWAFYYLFECCLLIDCRSISSSSTMHIEITQIMPRCDDGVIRVFVYFLSLELVADFLVSFSASKAV